MGSTIVPSPSTGSAKQQLGFSHDDTPATSKSSLGLSGSSQSTEGSSMKQGNKYHSSSNLPSDSGNDFGQKEEQTTVPLNRLNLDLNILMDSFDNCSSSSIERQSDIKHIETGGLQKKLESHSSSELAGTSTGSKSRDARPGKCMIQKHVYDFGLGNLYPASSKQKNFEVSLDLQLKPPCKPEPKFNWSDFTPAKEDTDEEWISLGLSLLSSCVKPELHGTRILKNSNVELDLGNLSSSLHVNSEPCHSDVSLKSAGPSNLLSDRSGSTKSASPSGRAQGHPKGTGEVSPPKVATSDRKTGSIMVVPQSFCGNKVNFFNDNFETSCGSKVKDLYSNFEIDLNIPLSDSDGSSQATANSSKPTFAEVSLDCIDQDHDEAHHDEVPESSLLLKGTDVIVANSSHPIPEPTELEPKEMDTATNASGADGSGSLVSQGNKPGIPDILSGDHSKMVNLNCNGSASSKVSSDEVHMELDGKRSVADSGETIEEFEEELDEVCSEEIEEYEEIIEEVSGEESEEVFEEVEVSCDDQLDGSHLAEGDENTYVEEFEEVVEEVACDDESDRSHHGENVEHIEPESDSLCSEYEDGEIRGQRIDGVNSVAVNVPTTLPSQEDEKEEHVENAKDCMEEKKVEATMLENPQPSVLDASTTTRNMPLKTMHDWGIKSSLDKDIAEAAEGGSTKPSQETRGTKSSLDNDIAEAAEEGNTKQGFGSWETKPGPKDTPAATRRGRCEASRHQNTERYHSDTQGDARNHKVPLVKGGRIITFKKTSPERSSFAEGQHDHARATPRHIERDTFPAKPFRHDKPHAWGHRDDQHNRPFHRPDYNRNEPNRFGIRRPDYIWVRNEDDSSHYGQKFERRVLRRGLQYAQPQQYEEIYQEAIWASQRYAEGPQKRRRDSPVNHNSGSFSSSRPRLRSPQFNEGRGARWVGGDYGVRERKVWHDPKFSDAGFNRRR